MDLLPSTALTNDYNVASVVKHVDISYNTIRFNGSLLKENIFRQDAGPEVDAAWQSLGIDCKSLLTPSTITRILADILLDRSIVIPADEAQSSGLRLDQVKINKKYGGGYPANVEGLHQLHCLVSLSLIIHLRLRTEF